MQITLQVDRATHEFFLLKSNSSDAESLFQANQLVSNVPHDWFETYLRYQNVTLKVAKKRLSVPRSIGTSSMGLPLNVFGVRQTV